MAKKFGENARSYWSSTLATSLTYTYPTATADNIRNLKVDAKHDEVDVTVRVNNGHKSTEAGLTDIGITFEIKVPDTGGSDTFYSALQTAWAAKGQIAFYCLSDDHATAGAEGPGGNWSVLDFGHEEKDGERLFRSVTLKTFSWNKWDIITGS